MRPQQLTKPGNLHQVCHLHLSYLVLIGKITLETTFHKGLFSSQTKCFKALPILSGSYILSILNEMNV